MCDIVQINRELPRVNSIPYASAEAAMDGARDYDKSLSPYYMLLSRTNWKFDHYTSPGAADASASANFFDPSFDVSEWDDIYVPRVWQTEGYDHPIYTNTSQKFSGNFGNPSFGSGSLPAAPTVFNPVGLYRRDFTIPADWDGSRVYVNFEGVNSAFYLWVNGHKVGYAEDSFTSDEFDITDYVVAGQSNTIAVKVYRWCDGSWIEDQDFFDFSGIFRDVYVYATPTVRVRDYEIVTDFDSTFTDSTLKVNADVRNYTGNPQDATLKVRLFDADKNEVALGSSAVFSASLQANEEKNIATEIAVAAPRKWSAEDPYLYTLVLEETVNGKTVYESYQVGFRKITYKANNSGWFEGSTANQDLIRINGVPLCFRGVNRHEMHPRYAYAVPQDVMVTDIRLMKELNVNAVRTSHYPNSPYLYYLCDKYGIYVLDEANQECHSNQSSNNARMTDYLSAAIIDRQYNMVDRDKNHASVVMWSLGNESGSPAILNTVLVNPYANQSGNTYVLHAYEPTRPWHYEQAGTSYSRGVDVRSTMYAGVGTMVSHGQANGAAPYIQCEYAHSMGNSTGNLDEFWDAIDTYRNLQGAFIWDYIDQGIYKTANEGGSVTYLQANNDPALRTELKNGSLVEQDGREALKGYTTFNNASKLDITGYNLTVDVEAYFNPPTATGTQHYEVLTKGDSQFAIKYATGIHAASTPVVEFYIYDGAQESNARWQSAYWVLPSDVLATWYNSWHRLTGSYDGTALKLYVDGVLRATLATNVSISSNGYPVSINVNQEQNRTSDAYVSSAKIFNKSMTLAELDAATASDPNCALWLEPKADNLKVESVEPVVFFGYGGDFGESVHDGAFSQNGILFADRTPQPESHEVKYQYQEVKFAPVNLNSGLVEIKNFFLFTDLADKYTGTWTLIENATPVQSGALTEDMLNVPTVDPMTNQPGTKTISLPYTLPTNPTPGSEYFVRLSLALKEDEGLLKAGHEIAKVQFQVPFSAGRPQANPVSGMDGVTISTDGNIKSFTGDNFKISFDTVTGKIYGYEVDGKALIVPGNGPKGSFYRAVLDNDRGASSLNATINRWKTVDTMTVNNMTIDDSNPKAVKISVEGTYATANNMKMYIDYIIYGNGQIEVKAKMAPVYSTNFNYIPVAGMQLTVPEEFENLDFFGRGPLENYNDRKAGYDIGRYQTTVTDNFIPYMKPQETGNRTGVRWVSLTNDEGFGLLAVAKTPIEMSALHYTPQALSNAAHPHELSKIDDTILRLNVVQMGVGGDNSWGAMPHAPYLPSTNAVYEYAYTLSPILPSEDAMAKSLTVNEESASTSYLEAAIARAEALKAQDYSAGSYAALTLAVANAKAVLDDENLTYEILDPLQTAIETAIANLVSISGFVPVFQKANAANPANYTYASYKQMIDAYDAAQAAYQNADVTKAVAESALLALNQAVNGLVPLVGEDTTIPPGVINVYPLTYALWHSDIDKEMRYTDLSVYLYQRTIAEAQSILDTPTSQKEVNQALANVQAAPSKLVVKTASNSSKELVVTNNTTYPKFGTTPSWNNNSATTYLAAWDGNTSTYFDYINDQNGYTGVDLGEGNNHIIGTVRISARSSYVERTLGAMIQGSNDMENWTTLGTLTTAAAAGTGTLLALDNDVSWRYIRYFAPTGNCNVAEVRLYTKDVDVTLLNGLIEMAPFALKAVEGLDEALTAAKALADQNISNLTNAMVAPVVADLAAKLEAAGRPYTYNTPETVVTTNEPFTFNVVTSGQATGLKLTNEPGNIVGAKVLSRVTLPDGTLQWTVQTAVGTAGTGRTLHVMMVDAEKNLIDTGATVVFDVKKAEPEINSVSASVQSVLIDEIFEVTVVTSNGISALMFVNELDKKMGVTQLSSTVNADGTITRVFEMAIGSAGTGRTITVKGDNGTGSYAYTDTFSINVLKVPAGVVPEVISISAPESALQYADFEVTVVTSLAVEKIALFNPANDKAIGSKQVSKIKDNATGTITWVLTTGVGTASTAPRTIGVKVAGDNGVFVDSDTFEILINKAV